MISTSNRQKVVTSFRGALRIVAGILVFSITYDLATAFSASEIGPQDFALIVACSLPWIILCVSGLHDLTSLFRGRWPLWVGLALLAVSIYSHTTGVNVPASMKATIIVAACMTASLPSIVVRLRFLNVAASLLAGGAGLLAIDDLLTAPLNRTFKMQLAVFVISGICAAVLSLIPCANWMFRRIGMTWERRRTTY